MGVIEAELRTSLEFLAGLEENSPGAGCGQVWMLYNGPAGDEGTAGKSA